MIVVFTMSVVPLLMVGVI